MVLTDSTGFTGLLILIILYFTWMKTFYFERILVIFRFKQLRVSPTKSFFLAGIKSYQEIASYTSGQIFPLKTHAEITQFTSYVKSSLRSGTTIAKGAFSHFAARGKRSSTTHSSFYVDSTVDTLIITLNVMQQNTARMVTLADSSGKKYTAQSTTAYNQVYTIENPKQGKWLLSFPVYTGAHSFVAKAYGGKSVDFVTYFMHQERQNGPLLTIANPLKGKKLVF